MTYFFCGVSCEFLVCFSACTYGCNCLPIDNESGAAPFTCAPEDPGNTNNDLGSSVGSLLQCNEEKPINDRSPAAESPPVGPSCSSRAPEGDFLETSTSSSVHQNPLKRRKHESKGKVAFVKVKVGANSRTDKLDSRIKSAADKVDEKKEDEDPFFSMLTGGNMKRSFF